MLACLPVHYVHPVHYVLWGVGGGLEGVWRGSLNVWVSAVCGGLEGIYQSSLDARQPQSPLNSEEYQGHLQ
eukprot:1105547-Prorocentrum_minimum.AAC.1